MRQLGCETSSTGITAGLDSTIETSKTSCRSCRSMCWGGAAQERDKLEAFNRAITRTIELSCEVTHEGVKPDGSATPTTTGPDVYRRFWRALLNALGAGRELPTILTFN